MEPGDTAQWIGELLWEHSKFSITGQMKIGELRRIWEVNQKYPKNVEIKTFTKSLIIARHQVLYQKASGRSPRIDEPLDRLYNEVTDGEDLDLELIDFLRISKMYWKYGKEDLISGLMGYKKDRSYWSAVRNILENDPNLKMAGSNRGRSYRHKMARQTIQSEIIAEIIETYLEYCEKEVTWKEIFVEINPILHEFHRQTDIGDNDNFSNGGELIISSNSGLRWSASWNYMEAYRTDYTYNNELESWFGNVYTEGWFRKTASDIQRHLKSRGHVARGSHKNVWVHVKYGSKIGSVNNFAGVLKVLEDLSNDIMDTRKKFSKLEDIELLHRTLKDAEKTIAEEIDIIRSDSIVRSRDSSEN